MLTESTPRRQLLSCCYRSFFNELLGAASNVVAATDYSVSHRTHVQLDSADCVIVAWDDVVNAFRAAVGIDYADNRDAQLVGLVIAMRS